MADRNGYIGRAPSDSAVTVARQSFAPTGVTTDFTFASGYTPGYFDLFINGVKMIEGSDYTSTDGSTFAVLNGGAQNGDVLEGVAYKAFNVTSVSNANANFTVGGDLAVSGNLNVTGIATLGAGTSVSFATTAYALEGTPDLTIRNLTGVAATFSGVVTYEDVTNIDSVGIVTAQGGLNVVGGGATVTGVSTFFDTVRVGSAITLGASSGIITATGLHVGTAATLDASGFNITGVITATSFVGDGTGLTGVASTDNIITSTASTFANINSTGIVTAVSFSGDGSGLSGVGGQLDITSSLFT